MSTTKTTRRTPQQWQTLIDQWQQSGLSAAQFCKDRGIGYASLCQWRKKLGEPTERCDGPDTGFLDLSTLAESKSGWQIVLSLGNGVELRLSQG